MRLPPARHDSKESARAIHSRSCYTRLSLAPINHQKNMNLNMKFYRHLLIASTLLILPACEQKSNVNQSNGIKDAIDARPYENVRDAAEDAGDAVNKVGRDIKDAVKGAGRDIKNAVNGS